MSRLTAYLLRALALALLLVTLAITAAIWLTQSLRYVDVVVENGAPLHLFVWLALLTLPTFLSLVLPIAIFVAVLFTYHRFTLDSELIAMRACGLSPRLLIRPALLLGSAGVVLGLVISLWLQPLARQQLVQMQVFVQSQFSAALLREGIFNDLGNKMAVYVARRDRNAELSGILIQDGRDPQKSVTIRAARGQLVQSEGGPKVIVYDGVQQEFNRTERTLSELRFESYAVSLDTLVPAQSQRTALPRELPTFQLARAVQAGQGEARMLRRQIAELNQRLAVPFLSLSYALIAAAALLFGGYNRRGHTAKVAFAILTVAIVQAVVVALGQSIIRSNAAIIPLYLCVFAPIVVVAILLLRQPEVRWSK